MEPSLEQILAEIHHETGVPAVAGIVVRHDALIARAAIGVRRLGADEPVTIQDRFHAGSNTKAMTAALCASLVHNNFLTWETTPLDIFPDLDGKILSGYETITLEMLLTHKAGIPPYTDDEASDFVLPDLAGVGEEAQIKHFSKWLLQNREPINIPGSEFSYSNAGYSTAGAMVEAVTGKTWEENLEKYVFAPLEIDAEAAKGWPAIPNPDQPWGHLVLNGDMIPHPPDDEYQLERFLAPAGDVSISLPNYGKFLQMHLKGLQGKETILPNELVLRMHNHQEPGTGMGWGVTQLRSLESLGMFSTHAGSAGTFILVAGISHARDCAAALATNSGKPEVMQGIKRIISAFMKQDNNESNLNS